MHFCGGCGGGVWWVMRGIEGVSVWEVGTCGAIYAPWW